MKEFYTYLWLREDGTPYYVGKGHGRRAYVEHWVSGNFKRQPPSKERIVIYPAESEADAFETEVALIWYYGRKDLGTGCLRNLTSGGEGAGGRSEEWKRKRSIAYTGKKQPKSEKWIKNITARNKLNAKDPVWLAKSTFQKGMTAWNKGKPAWNKGVAQSEEQRQRNSEAHMGVGKGRKHSEETKRKIKATNIETARRRKENVGLQ